MTERDVILALPKNTFLSDYVRWAISRTDAHALYHVAGGLAILTQTVPADLAIPYGSRLFPNVYFLIVADSADRKSVAIEMAGNMLREAIPDAVVEEPGSPAGLIDGIARRPQQLVLYPEFGSILSQSVVGQLHPIRTLFSQAYDGGALGRNTLTGQREKRVSAVQNPRVSMLAGCSPEFLEAYTDPTAWGGGFMGRFLFVNQQRERDERLVEKQIHQETVERGKRLVATIKEYAAHRGRTAEEELFTGGPAISPCRGLSPEAERLHVEWCASRPSALLRGPVASPAKSTIGRAETVCLKIAFLVQWDLSAEARAGIPWFISEMAMRFAIFLCDVHLDSAMEIIQVVALDRDAQDRRRLVSLLDSIPRARSDLLAQSRLSMRRFNEAIMTLVEGRRIQCRTREGDPELYYSTNDPGGKTRESAADLFTT